MSSEFSLESIDFTEGDVRRRLVLNFPGFEKMGSEACLDRLQYCAEKTGSVFGFSVTRDGTEDIKGDHHAYRAFGVAGANWQVDSRVVQFDWHDIVERYENRRYPIGFLMNLIKYLAIFVDGTLLRYLSASKLYFAFSVYPAVLMIVLAIIAVLAGQILIGVTGLAGWAGGFLQWVVAFTIWLILCRWPGDYLYLNTTVSNWGFARDLTRRTSIIISERLDTFSDVLANEIRTADVDEITVCGHSLGSVWAVSALVGALRKDPELLTGRSVTFLSLGSSHLKIALNAGGAWLTDELKELLACPALFWHEFQTKDDVIAFYKSDPFEPIGIDDTNAEVKVDRIRFKRGMSRKRYRSMRGSFYATHNQYVRYFEKPVLFDFYLRLFGSLSARQLSIVPDVPEGAGEPDEDVMVAS